MQQELKKIEAEARRRLELASDNDAVSLIRSEILGKKGSLGAVFAAWGSYLLMSVLRLASWSTR